MSIALDRLYALGQIMDMVVWHLVWTRVIPARRPDLDDRVLRQ